MDEVSKQLLRDLHQPLPIEPGRPQRRDYEYERGGVVNPFLFCEPLQGRRREDVTDRRAMTTDWAGQIKKLVDERYPEAERIVLVMDNLNTPHTPASLALRDVRSGRSQAARRQAEDTLHAQAR